jgi:hypothetical protein
MSDEYGKKRKGKFGDKVGKTSKVRDTNAGTVTKTKTYKDDSGNLYQTSKSRRTAAQLASDIRDKISEFRVGTNKNRRNANISKQALLEEQKKKIQGKEEKKKAKQNKQLSKIQGKINIAKKKQELKKTKNNSSYQANN